MAYGVTHRKGEVEGRKVQCILHEEESLCSARLDLWLVNVVKHGSPFQKVWNTFIYFLSIMSTKSVEH